MLILGIDVSKSSVVVCPLLKKPPNARAHFHDSEYFYLEANKQGIHKLLQFQADIAIIEPTGTNYSKLWVEYLLESGCEVRLADHAKIRNYRKNHLGLPDKDDYADSLALGCYGWDYLDIPSRFISLQQPNVAKLRSFILRLNHLNHCQSPIINRIRQDLAWQFPEVAHSKSQRRGDKPALLWAFLAGEETSKRYENKLLDSIGLGVTESVTAHAQRLCSIQREEAFVELNLKRLVQNKEFAPYLKVFDEFCFGFRLNCLLLSQVFPFDKFLGQDGKPIIKRSQGRSSKKPTKKNLSSRRFQKCLGVAPSEASSGDTKKKRVVGGSAQCRKALWLWVMTRLEVKKSRPNTEVCQKLIQQLDEEKFAGRPGKLIQSRISAKAVKLLYKELVKELVNG